MSHHAALNDWMNQLDPWLLYTNSNHKPPNHKQKTLSQNSQ